MAIASNPIALGKVVVSSAGTPVQLTSDTTVECNTVIFQSWHENTGKIYIGNSSLNKSTGVGLYYIIPAAGEGFSLGGGDYANIFKPSDIYIDADTNDESAVVALYVR